MIWVKALQHRFEVFDDIRAVLRQYVIFLAPKESD